MLRKGGATAVCLGPFIPRGDWRRQGRGRRPSWELLAVVESVGRGRGPAEGLGGSES